MKSGWEAATPNDVAMAAIPNAKGLRRSVNKFIYDRVIG